MEVEGFTYIRKSDIFACIKTTKDSSMLMQDVLDFCKENPGYILSGGIKNDRNYLSQFLVKYNENIK